PDRRRGPAGPERLPRGGRRPARAGPAAQPRDRPGHRRRDPPPPRRRPRPAARPVAAPDPQPAGGRGRPAPAAVVDPPGPARGARRQPARRPARLARDAQRVTVSQSPSLSVSQSRGRRKLPTDLHPPASFWSTERRGWTEKLND